MNERKHLIRSLRFPVLFLILICLVKLLEYAIDYRLSFLGIYPRKFFGLVGVFTGPLVHGSLEHLAANSLPFLVLTVGIFYFYQPVAYRIFLLNYFITGFGIWLIGRESFHIGASGLVYASGAYLFFSGILSKHRNLLAISLLVVFLYGSMIWGIFPSKPGISWEGHLMGFLAGIFTAFAYREERPYGQKVSEENNDDPDNQSNVSSTMPDVNLNYIYKK